MKAIALVLFCSLMACVTGCNQKSAYQQMVEEELNRTVHKDSLFLGYKFGMHRSEFYDRSWALNQKKLVLQGPANQSVRYELKDLPHPAVMYYSPEYWNDKIYQMKVRIQYQGWAPWNKNLSSDSLQVDVVHMLEQWYGGNNFLKIAPQKGTPVFVKVDGNREIRVMVKNQDASVWVFFTDLRSVRKMNKEKNS